MMSLTCLNKLGFLSVQSAPLSMACKKLQMTTSGLFFPRLSSALRAKMRRKIEFNKKFFEFSEKSV